GRDWGLGGPSSAGGRWGSAPGRKGTPPDERLTIRPHPAATIPPTNTRQVRYGPTVLTIRVSIQSAGSVRENGSNGPNTAAALTRIDAAPNRTWVSRARRSTARRDGTSASTASGSRPVVSWIERETARRAPRSRAVTTTSACALARATAISRPTPRLAPVTTATLPASLRSTSSPKTKDPGYRTGDRRAHPPATHASRKRTRGARGSTSDRAPDGAGSPGPLRAESARSARARRRPSTRLPGLRPPARP